MPFWIAYSYYNFKPWGTFEPLTSLSLIENQAFGTRSTHGGRKISEKSYRLLMFVMDWNLARWVRKSYCARKCKNMNINNLITGAFEAIFSPSQRAIVIDLCHSYSIVAFFTLRIGSKKPCMHMLHLHLSDSVCCSYIFARTPEYMTHATNFSFS